MRRYGHRGLALKIFTSYLHARTHGVRTGRTVSDWLASNTMVTQGSLSGPILSLISINYLVSFSSRFLLIWFAEDTTPHISDHNAQNLILQCNSGIITIQNGNISNKLSINEGNPHCMAVTLRSLQRFNRIRFNGKILEFKNQCNFFGKFFDNKLKIKSQSDYIASKIFKSTRVFF